MARDELIPCVSGYLSSLILEEINEVYASRVSFCSCFSIVSITREIIGELTHPAAKPSKLTLTAI